jgi:hypothetical protein
LGKKGFYLRYSQTNLPEYVVFAGTDVKAEMQDAIIMIEELSNLRIDRFLICPLFTKTC